MADRLWRRTSKEKKRSGTENRANAANQREPNSKGKERYDFSTTSEEVERHRQGFCPRNTKATTNWSVRNFEQWRQARNAAVADESCPSNILLSDNVSDLDYWLCKYLVETRREDGLRYPPRTLHALLSGIQRYVCTEKRNSVNLFADKEFHGLRNICDSL